MIQTVGVSLGDCMAPVLFLFMVMASAKTLENVWMKARLQIVTFRQHVDFPSFTHTLLLLVLICTWGEDRKSPKPNVSSFPHQGSSVGKALCLLLTG